MAYTWTQFRNDVLTLLPVDKDRLGMAEYIASQTRQAVIELQSYIPAYRIGHETLYLANDFAGEGRASVGVLPPQAVVQDCYLVHLLPDGKSCHRYPLHDFEWGKRMELIHGRLNADHKQAHISIDPYAYKFYVYPQVKDCWLVSIFWDGLKLEFQDDEDTPFDEGMAGAVAELVQAKLARKVDNDLPLHNSFMLTYAGKRKQLYLDAKDRGRTQR